MTTIGGPRESESLPDQNHEETNVSSIQSIFNTTKCYDLMQISYKAIVFEIPIPFQLSFYAMIEHDTDVAPLWDPEKRCFVGLMTLSDYIQALHLCIMRNIPIIELSSKAISDMLSSPIMTFLHPTFESLDAEDSIFQLCRYLRNSNAQYVPIVDPENGNLVSILGYMDLVRLLDHAAKQYSMLFNESLEQMGIGTFQNVYTANKSTLLHDLLTQLLTHGISGVPVLDEAGRVYNYYHKSDVTFITKATDPEAILTNLNGLTVGEAISMRDLLQQSGESMSACQSLVTCTPSDAIGAVLHAMMVYRVTRVVCVDVHHMCMGIVSIKDILNYYVGGLH